MGIFTSMEALKTADLKDGQMKEVNVGGHEILIARVNGSFYAASNRCPHMGAKLSQGKLEGTVVTCPRHGSQFNLSDGSVVRWTKWTGLVGSAVKLIKSPKPIAVYSVKVEGQKVLVDI
jgi:3-phenylpropionate/trans-cinnamate dioxygenase ferredoxin subunit